MNKTTLLLILTASIVVASNFISFKLGENKVSQSPITHEYWRGWEDAQSISAEDLALDVYKDAYKEGYHKATVDLSE